MNRIIMVRGPEATPVVVSQSRFLEVAGAEYLSKKEALRDLRSSGNIVTLAGILFILDRGSMLGKEEKKDETMSLQNLFEQILM